MPILSGPLRGRRWTVGSGTHGCWLGTYERDGQRLATRLLSRGMVVYDLGANAGFYSLLFSTIVGERGCVVAFEPAARSRVLLARNLEANGCANVRVVSKAVADIMKRGYLESAEGPCQARLAESGPEEIEITTLDHEIFDLATRVPSVVKVDVEGAEVRVLRGAKRLSAEVGPTWWVETHGWEAHQQCKATLVQYGYEIADAVETGPTGHGRLLAMKPELCHRAAHSPPTNPQGLR